MTVSHRLICTLTWIVFLLVFVGPLPAQIQFDDKTSVTMPHAAAVGVRKGASVYMLGEVAGKVAEFGYSADGQHVELELDLAAEFQPQVVRASRVVIGRDANGAYLEIVRTTDMLGMDVAAVAGGVTVTSMKSDGPAANAGVQVGDKVTSVAGQPTRAASLASAMKGVKKGDSVKIKLLRNNKPVSLTATADPSAGMTRLPGGTPLRLASAVRSASGGASSATMNAVGDTVTEASEFLTHLGADADILMSDLKDLTDNAGKMMEKLAGEMEYVPGTMMEVREMMQNAGQMVEKFQAMSSGLDGMMSNAQSSMCQVNEMVTGVRNTRIMKTIVNRSQRRSGSQGMFRRR